MLAAEAIVFDLLGVPVLGDPDGVPVTDTAPDTAGESDPETAGGRTVIAVAPREISCGAGSLEALLEGAGED